MTVSKFNQNTSTGGIDLTLTRKNLQTKNNGKEIQLQGDTVMLTQLKNALGLTVSTIKMRPINSLTDFWSTNQ